MDIAARLIRLQRITIAVLSLVIVALVVHSRAADQKAAQWREDVVSAQQQIQRVSEKSQADQRIISLMGQRMRNAERSAPSVYITRSPDGTLTAR